MADVIAMQCWLMLLPWFYIAKLADVIAIVAVGIATCGIMYHLADVIAILMIDICYAFMLLFLADVIANG